MPRAPVGPAKSGSASDPGPSLLAEEPARRFSLVPRLRAYFLTGVIVTAPIAITIYLLWNFISFLDRQVGNFIPTHYNPETYLPFSLPGLGLLLMLASLTLVGMLTAGFVGRSMVRLGEALLARMPIVRSVYSTLKQLFESLLTHSSRSFREVVLIEYPRRGIGSIAFVTGPTRGEIQARSEDELVNVYLPTTPVPTSGFLLFVPRKDLVHLDMTVEEALKLVISGGIVSGDASELAGSATETRFGTRSQLPPAPSRSFAPAQPERR